MLLDLALVGFGNVARQFVRLIGQTRICERLAIDHDLNVRIVGIATARHGSIFEPTGLDAVRVAQAIERGDTLRGNGSALALIERLATMPRGDTHGRVVVETTTLDVKTGRPAIDHVRAALEAGCHVVTTNKGPAAHGWRALDELARARAVSFLFEGAVMDGIPIFNLVRETLPAVRVTGFRGIVNATTNHVLTTLEEGGEFGPALEEMQRAGIAEADPSLDVDGWDAAAKTAALANVLMGAELTPADVDRTGIRTVTGSQARAAVARGRRIRLVASARESSPSGSAHARVAPEELPSEDPLASLRGMANAIVFETDLLGEVMVTQLSGGLTQTAYAIVTDLVRVAHRARSDGAAPAR
jgi:homoserine dehydrogenase